MYELSTPLSQVKGIGPKIAASLEQAQIETVADLLRAVPLGYDDRSQLLTIDQLRSQPQNTPCTIAAQVTTTSFVRRPGRTMQTATVKDSTGSTRLLWFNNSFVLKTLRRGNWYHFAGKIGKNGTIIQPTFEAIGNNIHTNRLVPRYTSTLLTKQGTLRRILKHILDELLAAEQPELDVLTKTAQQISYIIPTMIQSIWQLHFPDSIEQIPAARERLALEELLSLIKQSHQLKIEWRQLSSASLSVKTWPERSPMESSQTPPLALQTKLGQYILPELPFQLTQGQNVALTEILDDLTQEQPMNRLLVGDVGSGKTIVAFLALESVLHGGGHAMLIAPTQILAEQHVKKFRHQFPNLACELVTGKDRVLSLKEPTCLIGTHALLNRWQKMVENSPIGLVVFDEQHRFGVAQRSELFTHSQGHAPHRLTMTATPIPRSLMLTIFSHLSLSVINELPANRLPTKTWLLPEEKRESFHEWLYEQIQEGRVREKPFQVIVVCPFIDPSEEESHQHIPAATQRYKDLSRWGAKKGIRVEILHSKLPVKQKAQTIEAVFAGQVDVLVSTPVVEVGVDIPQASAIVIEAAERFGLASLHQLRGRVGRSGQQGYCALFRSPSHLAKPDNRLQLFTEIHTGQELADLDLKFRGPGDLFGTEQSGFDHLHFASWTNLDLIGKAQQLAKLLPDQWESFILPRPNNNTGRPVIPLAN